MIFSLTTISSDLIQEQAVSEIIKCNDFTYQYGLKLTYTQAVELIGTRSYALWTSGRIEFGGGIIEKFIRAFCDSPFLQTHNYAQTLNELIELFYHFKTEYNGLIRDNDLIEDMKKAFDGDCRGSVELLSMCTLEMVKKEFSYDYELKFVEDYEIEEDEDYE